MLRCAPRAGPLCQALVSVELLWHYASLSVGFPRLRAMRALGTHVAATWCIGRVCGLH